MYYSAKIYSAKLLNNIESIESLKLISHMDNFSDFSSNIELMTFRDMRDFQKYYSEAADKRLSIEKHLADKYRKNISWLFQGYCHCCERITDFLIDWRYSDGVVPNYRERLICSHCRLNNRQRFMYVYLKNMVRDRKGASRLFCYEQVTHFYRKLIAQLRNIDVKGSEYLGNDKTPGAIINNIRHEDALSMSFENELFDIIISNDIYEHVPDITKSLSEAYRCLKEGGFLIFSVPLFINEKTTHQRATINNEGKLIHLLPDQYHGNPISQKGSLVFYDFGWDILDSCKDAGFNDSYMIAYYSMCYGYIGNGIQFIFRADK